MNPNVDDFLAKAKKWQAEMLKLRTIVLGFVEFTEELKWNKPCYSVQDNNVLIILGFKEYFAVSFFKGSLLKDPQGILISPGENSQASRQFRFTHIKEIVDNESVLKAFIQEAIEIERSGLKINFKKTSEYSIPEELQTKFDEDAAFRSAFNSLTPGRQRAYLLHFSAPKQSITRVQRIEKYQQQILNGKGLND